MSTTLMLLPAAALAAFLFTIPPAAAQQQPETDPTRVLVTVNGVDITLGHVIVARAKLPSQYDNASPTELMRAVLDQLIRETLLMQAADDSPSALGEVILENTRRTVLAGDAANPILTGEVPPERLLEAYQAAFPEDSGELDYRASHILVGSEAEAQEVLAEIESGEDFGGLARERSIGPSASVGGDLGWFGRGRMVASFFEATAALSPGDVSQPLKTEFGWHVIKLHETRDRVPPPIDAIRPQLEQALREAMLAEWVQKLAADATVEWGDLEGLDPAAISNIGIMDK